MAEALTVSKIAEAKFRRQSRFPHAKETKIDERYNDVYKSYDNQDHSRGKGSRQPQQSELRHGLQQVLAKAQRQTHDKKTHDSGRLNQPQVPLPNFKSLQLMERETSQFSSNSQGYLQGRRQSKGQGQIIIHRIDVIEMDSSDGNSEGNNVAIDAVAANNMEYHRLRQEHLFASREKERQFEAAFMQQIMNEDMVGDFNLSDHDYHLVKFDTPVSRPSTIQSSSKYGTPVPRFSMINTSNIAGGQYQSNMPFQPNMARTSTTVSSGKKAEPVVARPSTVKSNTEETKLATAAMPSRKVETVTKTQGQNTDMNGNAVSEPKPIDGSMNMIASNKNSNGTKLEKKEAEIKALTRKEPEDRNGNNEAKPATGNDATSKNITAEKSPAPVVAAIRNKRFGGDGKVTAYRPSTTIDQFRRKHLQSIEEKLEGKLDVEGKKIWDEVDSLVKKSSVKHAANLNTVDNSKLVWPDPYDFNKVDHNANSIEFRPRFERKSGAVDDPLPADSAFWGIEARGGHNDGKRSADVRSSVPNKPSSKLEHQERNKIFQDNVRANGVTRSSDSMRVNASNTLADMKPSSCGGQKQQRTAQPKEETKSRGTKSNSILPWDLPKAVTEDPDNDNIWKMTATRYNNHGYNEGYHGYNEGYRGYNECYRGYNDGYHGNDATGHMAMFADVPGYGHYEIPIMHLPTSGACKGRGISMTTTLPRITPSSTPLPTGITQPPPRSHSSASMYAPYPPRDLSASLDYLRVPGRINPLAPPPPRRRINWSWETTDQHHENEKRSQLMQKREHTRYHSAWSKAFYGAPAEKEAYRRHFRDVLKQQMSDKKAMDKQEFQDKIVETEQAISHDKHCRDTDANEYHKKHTYLMGFRDGNKMQMENRWADTRYNRELENRIDRERLRYNPINWSCSLK